MIQVRKSDIVGPFLPSTNISLTTYPLAFPPIQPPLKDFYPSQSLNVDVPLRSDLSPLLSLFCSLSSDINNPNFKFHPSRSSYPNSRPVFQKALSSTWIFHSQLKQHNQKLILPT